MEEQNFLMCLSEQIVGSRILHTPLFPRAIHYRLLVVGDETGLLDAFVSCESKRMKIYYDTCLSWSWFDCICLYWWIG